MLWGFFCCSVSVFQKHHDLICTKSVFIASMSVIPVQHLDKHNIAFSLCQTYKVLTFGWTQKETVSPHQGPEVVM